MENIKMTCKDCICYEILCMDTLQDNELKLCKHFKNKADFVEVPCRCGECRFNVANMEKDGFDITDYSGKDIVCSYFLTDGMLPDDFCSYGERRQYEKSSY